MPTLDPLLSAPVAVQIHVAAAMAAIAFLPFTLFRKKRDRVHKTAGYVWVLVMATAALSSFFIRGLGGFAGFSPIHLISIYTLVGLWLAVRAAIRRDLVRHRAAMSGMAFGALGVAGVLSLMPGRRMNEALFGDYGAQGFYLSLAVAVVVVGVVLSKRREAQVQ